MNPKIISRRGSPEAIIQAKFEEFLILRKWSVRATHGNMYQHGFPDLYCCHNTFGARWIECKNPLNYRFTGAQLEYFPELNAHGQGIWVITAATEDQYKRLFGPQNWYHYLKF